MNRYKIAIVEDEHLLQQLLMTYIRQAGMEVICFDDYPQVQQAIKDESISAWVLDIMLPNGDGREILAKIREYNTTIPVMMLSARDSEYDRIQGLELGSDDYITKPFSPKEVVLRLQKLLQRTYGHKQLQTAFSLGSYILDLQCEQVLHANGQKIELTYREFQLLVYLVRHHQKPVTREQLLQHVWGSDYFGSDRVVDDLIRRLRKKMPELELTTIYGQGYRLS